MTAIADLHLERVAVVEDDPSARQAYKRAVEDMDVAAVPEEGPLAAIDDYAADLNARVDAAFCDFHLKNRAYAEFNGDRLAARLYRLKMPVVLCTNYTDWEVSLVRRYRRYIPRVIQYDEAEPETIWAAFATCAAEFNGEFTDTRRPWRTLVRIDEINEEGGYTYVVVPGWSPRKRIRVQKASFPSEVFDKVRSGVERLHAQVNLGADADEDLYFVDWEL